ncbi:COX15/CtaA family protein [Cellulomonas bogoriensis]|uniref:Cytochrome oxidase assembly protein n=1 Tax=Cellulomonas bogoriensis 69B4 = DSM 16987 TaxID=1386082 RepID=A0A0A0C0H0_9CELL|nr:COX15/CtaA family protein [Cellulomonas bogoriensis]KGM13671.1 cytochrome oxidase assembly protein [Cellulomonas bogoriensis 69B4 = DSM 16987]
MSAAPPPPATAADGPGVDRDPRPRRAPSYRWARRILWANLVAQIGIVVTGGAVRLTDSGLGCSTWPQCEPGRFTPELHEADSLHGLVEFGNRTLTGVLGILALLTAWVVWRERHRLRSYRLLGLVPLVGVAVQAVVGGLTVLLELHPAWVGAHFLISMVLIAASAALLRRHREGDAPPVPLVDGSARALTRGLVAVAVVVIGLGVVVTGAGPHSGDTEIAQRLPLDPVATARVHAAAVWVYLTLLVALVVVVHRRTTGAVPRDAAVVLLVVTLAQGAIGYVQFFTGLPEVLVAAHMLGAGVLVVAQVNQVMSLRERARSGQRDVRGAQVTPVA